jgi:hypothetical protein
LKHGFEHEVSVRIESKELLRTFHQGLQVTMALFIAPEEASEVRTEIFE